jgi:MscS family membrane protein
MLLWSKQEFAATGHDSFDANSLVMVTLRQATSSNCVQAGILLWLVLPSCAITGGSTEGRIEGLWQKIQPAPEMAETSRSVEGPEGRPRRAGRHFMDSAQRKALSRHSGLAGRSQATIAPIFAVILFVALATRSEAQLATSATSASPKPESVPALDPLGRGTPRSAVMGLLKCAENKDSATAARYLQAPPGQEMNLEQRAKEFLALSSRFKSNIGWLSDDPKGSIEPGLPPGKVRAGVIEVGGTTTDIILVRVDDLEYGKIWLVSQETIAKVPSLYARIGSEGPTLSDRILPASLTNRYFLGMSLAQWLGWLISLPLSWSLAWLLAFLLSAPRRLVYKLRKRPLRTVWDTPIGIPLKCIIAILMHAIFVYLLVLPLLYRAYYFRFLAALLVGCFVWLVSKITDRGFDRVVNRTRTHGQGGESILILMQRLNRVVLVIIALVATMALFGLNVKTTLAGLGVGGLAIALAAQKSLENLIGGVSLLMDKAIHVGDFCKIGDQVGTVEDIGLRSLKMRTLDQNLSVVPNGSLAQMQFENMARRSKLLINQTFSLRIETQAEQLRFVLDRVQTMLDEHPAIEPETCRVRVMSFAGAAFQIELFAYVKTGDWAEFTAIRQELILKITEIVEAAGTRLAAPTQLTYLSADAGVDAEKAKSIANRVTELRASHSL